MYQYVIDTEFLKLLSLLAKVFAASVGVPETWKSLVHYELGHRVKGTSIHLLQWSAEGCKWR